MSQSFEIVVLCGGLSAEREVSLRSGEALEVALREQFPTRRVVLEVDALPEGLNPKQHVIFPAMHGAFGEDGQLQGLLEQAGFAYSGSDARSSALCMAKSACKACVRETGVPVLNDFVFKQGDVVDVQTVINQLGETLIVKPQDSGSSVGLSLVKGGDDLSARIQNMDTGSWMVEPRFLGRELTVGLLDGEAMGIVEIVSDTGIYDYAHKYQPGRTQYRAPASLDQSVVRDIGTAAQRAFEVCGCRDFARADFLYNEVEGFIFLEINTIPGLTNTSLLPKSAGCFNLDFPALCHRMITPAIHRFNELTS